MSEFDLNQCRLHNKNFVSICVDTCMCEDINIVQSFGSDKDHLGYDRGTRPCMFEWLVANLTT